VEEALRYDAPVQFLFRRATQDVEVAGATIPAGSMVMVIFGSANRDERRYPNPDRFDVGRDASGHVAFGHGIHFCLGAPLARLEGEIALGTLVRRLRGLELLADPPEYKENIVLRGLAALPAGFASAS